MNLNLAIGHGNNGHPILVTGILGTGKNKSKKRRRYNPTRREGKCTDKLRSSKIFKQMAQFIGSRDGVQCRSHHMKQFRTHKQIKKIIKHSEYKFQSKAGHIQHCHFQPYNRELESFQFYDPSIYHPEFIYPFAEKLVQTDCFLSVPWSYMPMDSLQNQLNPPAFPLDNYYFVLFYALEI